MADDVAKTLEGAKTTLANATKFTQNVEGNPTSSFAPKKTETPHVPQAHASHPANASYGMAREARDVGEGLAAKKQNVEDYAASTK